MAGEWCYGLSELPLCCETTTEWNHGLPWHSLPYLSCMCWSVKRINSPVYELQTRWESVWLHICCKNEMWKWLQSLLLNFAI